MPTLIESRYFKNQTENHDKVYICQFLHEDDGRYLVLSYYGRRLGTLQESRRRYRSQTEGLAAFTATCQDRINNGYTQVTAGWMGIPEGLVYGPMLYSVNGQPDVDREHRNMLSWKMPFLDVEVDPDMRASLAAGIYATHDWVYQVVPEGINVRVSILEDSILAHNAVGALIPMPPAFMTMFSNLARLINNFSFWCVLLPDCHACVLDLVPNNVPGGVTANAPLTTRLAQLVDYARHFPTELIIAPFACDGERKRNLLQQATRYGQRLAIRRADRMYSLEVGNTNDDMLVTGVFTDRVRHTIPVRIVSIDRTGEVPEFKLNLRRRDSEEIPFGSASVGEANLVEIQEDLHRANHIYAQITTDGVNNRVPVNAQFLRRMVGALYTEMITAQVPNLSGEMVDA